MPDPDPNLPRGPLAGVRVLDLSRVLAGPLCTMVLGDLGADVIKVERPGTGDDTRTWGPPWAQGPDGRESAYYLSVNRNKRSVAADLKAEDGRALVRRLARDADVVVENFAPGMLDGWGLGYAGLSRREPAPGLLLDHGIRVGWAGGGAAGLRFRGAGAGGVDVDYGRARGYAGEGRRCGGGRADGAERRHRHPCRAARAGCDPAAASGWRCPCSIPRWRGW